MHSVLFRVGSLGVPSYGALLLAGLAAGTALVLLRAPAGLSAHRVLELVAVTLVAGLVGAKLALVIRDPSLLTLSRLPGLVTAGGIFYAGLAAAALGLGIHARRAGLGLRETADLLAPALALAESLARLGCLAAGCCHGRATALPWAVVYTDPRAWLACGTPLGIGLHPVPLYLSLMALVLSLLLMGVGRLAPAPGTVFGLYLLLHGLSRWGIDSLRGPSQAAAWWPALAAVCAGLWLLAGRSRRPLKGWQDAGSGEPHAPPQPT